MSSLQHELVADSNAENVIGSVGLEGVNDGVSLTNVCCTSVGGDVVDTKVDTHIHLGLFDRFKLYACKYAGSRCFMMNGLYSPQERIDCNQHHTDECAERQSQRDEIGMIVIITYRSQL